MNNQEIQSEALIKQVRDLVDTAMEIRREIKSLGNIIFYVAAIVVIAILAHIFIIELLGVN